MQNIINALKMQQLYEKKIWEVASSWIADYFLLLFFPITWTLKVFDHFSKL